MPPIKIRIHTSTHIHSQTHSHTRIGKHFIRSKACTHADLSILFSNIFICHTNNNNNHTNNLKTKNQANNHQLLTTSPTTFPSGRMSFP